MPKADDTLPHPPAHPERPSLDHAIALRLLHGYAMLVEAHHAPVRVGNTAELAQRYREIVEDHIVEAPGDATEADNMLIFIQAARAVRAAESRLDATMLFAEVDDMHVDHALASLSAFLRHLSFTPAEVARLNAKHSGSAA
jgi:hypothetical protein